MRPTLYACSRCLGSYSERFIDWDSRRSPLCVRCAHQWDPAASLREIDRGPLNAQALCQGDIDVRAYIERTIMQTSGLAGLLLAYRSASGAVA